MALLGLSIAAQAVNIATVPVGDVGNVGELSGSSAGGGGVDRLCGSVSYDYKIGKYEVTAGQYTEFLNAKAQSDPYGLYNPTMWSGQFGCKIQRSGTPDSCNYTVASDYANRPVNYVSFWDACRFANWLHNGQGTGDTETGAYTLTPGGIADNTITRNANWKWAVTNEDEWYKAAYYKGHGRNSGYWDYPTNSSSPPGCSMADASGNNANYYLYSYLIGGPYYRTNVGQFSNSDSPYGTFDQGGNVSEWTESMMYGTCRAMRGGAYVSGVYFLQASCRSDYYRAAEENNITGFRVARTVPEPASLIVLAGGLVTLLGMMRRRAVQVGALQILGE